MAVLEAVWAVLRVAFIGYFAAWFVGGAAWMAVVLPMGAVRSGLTLWRLAFGEREASPAEEWIDRNADEWASIVGTTFGIIAALAVLAAALFGPLV